MIASPALRREARGLYLCDGGGATRIPTRPPQIPEGLQRQDADVIEIGMHSPTRWRKRAVSRRRGCGHLRARNWGETVDLAAATFFFRTVATLVV